MQHLSEVPSSPAHALDAPACKRPGCKASVFREGPDTIWCVNHGEQYTAEPPEFVRADRAGEAKSRRDVHARPSVR